MKPPLLITILFPLTIATPTHAFPIDTLINTISPTINQQCTDIIATHSIEITTNHDSHTNQQPIAIGQDCTAVADTYTHIIHDYFNYLTTTQAEDNNLILGKAEHDRQQYSLETQRIAQAQAHQLAIIEQQQTRFDNLLAPFVQQQESSAEAGSSWIQPLIQQH